LKHISLLPYEYKNRKRSGRILEISVVVMGIAAGIAVFIFVIASVLTVMPETELKAIKAENELLQSDIDALLPLKELSDNVKKLGNLVEKAVNGQPDWLEVFGFITAGIPDSIRVNVLSASYSGNTAILSIRGTAEDHGAVAGWMGVLNNSGSCSDISLNYSRSETASGGNGIEFELNVGIIRNEPFKLFREVPYEQE
jgi:Tfp pilus assembly protein PilN